MTAVRAARRSMARAASAGPTVRQDLAAAAAIVVVLAGIVGARWLATRQGLDALAVGTAFGLALVLLWVAAAGGRAGLGRTLAGLRPTLARCSCARAGVLAPLAAGLALGLALVVLALAGGVAGGNALVPGVGRPAAPFLPWAAVTVVVASAEEGILRGVLFDRIRHSGGPGAAIVVTAILFALIHVPAYGWYVVPLDLVVGIALGGLRVATGTVLAPAVAHSVADIATWWL